MEYSRQPKQLRGEWRAEAHSAARQVAAELARLDAEGFARHPELTEPFKEPVQPSDLIDLLEETFLNEWQAETPRPAR